MKMPVVFRSSVERQLDDAADWWEKHHSSEQAEKWYAGFVESLALLYDHPTRFPLAPENDAFPFEVRELHYGLGSRPTHRALFTIRPDMIYVICIRHLAQGEITLEDLL